MPILYIISRALHTMEVVSGYATRTPSKKSFVHDDDMNNGEQFRHPGHGLKHGGQAPNRPFCPFKLTSLPSR